MERHGIRFGALALVLAAASVGGCGGRPASGAVAAPVPPPGTPPSPAPAPPPGLEPSEPGEQAAALKRQLEQPWGRRDDKDAQLWAPLPDAGGWKRVRLWGVEHFTAFEYGSGHHALAVAFVQDAAPGETLTSRECMKRFEAWAWPQARSFDVKLTDQAEQRATWQGKPLLIRTATGTAPFGLGSITCAGAWAAYPAYSDGCLVYAIAVPWRDQRELAIAVRDRFVREGLTRLQPRTPTRPYRK